MIRRAFFVSSALSVLLIGGCEKEPEFVYILDAPQSVAISASSSLTKIQPGDEVVLHVRRSTTGRWRKIPMKERTKDQCRMVRVPPMSEDEVADNVRWTISPETSPRFNLEFRADHTRSLVLSEPGIYSLSASTGVWCEPGRSVTASPIGIEVVAQ